METTYNPPFVYKNPHINTSLPYFFRKPGIFRYFRERLNLPDGDFVDLDWVKRRSRTLLIQSHGLEGDSNSGYIHGMMNMFKASAVDFLTWNLRGCSGELNRLRSFYHSGYSHDLRAIINHVKGNYDEIILIGYSLGGNLTLKYLGEEGEKVDPKITKAVLVSVPLNLESSSYELARLRTLPYMQTFLSSMKKKLREKMNTHDYSDLNLKRAMASRSFADFDEYVTAPLHGFSGAKDYWTKSSSIHFIEPNRVPTLLINAKDDPFLGRDCFPEKVPANFKTLYPQFGGHLGFVQENLQKSYWHEDRAFEFLRVAPR